MSEQTKPDYRQLITEYVAGKHRATRHVDVCLDPDLADRIAAAQDALSDAEGDVEAVKNQLGGTIASPSIASAKKSAADAKAKLDELIEQARPASVRLTFMGIDSTAYTAFGRESRTHGRQAAADLDESQRETEEGLAQFAFESAELPARTLSSVTTVDGEPCGVTLDEGRALLAALPTSISQRCYIAAVEACTASVNLPF